MTPLELIQSLGSLDLLCVFEWVSFDVLEQSWSEVVLLEHYLFVTVTTSTVSSHVDGFVGLFYSAVNMVLICVRVSVFHELLLLLIGFDLLVDCIVLIEVYVLEAPIFHVLGPFSLEGLSLSFFL